MLLALGKNKSVIPWEVYVASITPDIWVKLTEATSAQVVSDGNWGTAGGSVAMTQTTSLLAQPSITPSDSSRTSFYRQNPSTDIITPDFFSTSYVSTATIVTAFKCNTAVSSNTTAQILWRSGYNGGGWFINLVGTNVALRIRGSNVTTSYASANIKDGNPHLISLSVAASTYNLYVDGVSVASGAVGGSTSTGAGWVYTTNVSPSNVQQASGWYNDFIVWTNTFTATDQLKLYNHWV